MTSWTPHTRAGAAYIRRIERDSIKRQRELEKQAKERAKLDAVEQARLEVAEFENRIEVLLSLHKECAEPTDWLAASLELPPAPPSRTRHHELRACQAMAVLPPLGRVGWEERIEAARLQDEHAFEATLQNHRQAHATWQKRVTLARRVRAGDPAAYAEAVNELSPLAEISHLGSSTEFSVHSSRLIECNLALNSSAVVPAETKTLTASQKVSVKTMPTARFHEIYQDYLCSCMLRVARELFALLPIDLLIVTARTAVLDTRTGHNGEHPVLSAAIPRDGLNGLNFDRIDPSDTIDSFPHRGDFKASRKAGAFLPIAPLGPADVSPASDSSLGLVEMLKRAVSLRAELAAELNALRSQTPSTP